MARAVRGVPTLLVGVLLIAVLFTAYTAQTSLAHHEPADKVAVAGSTRQVIGVEADPEVIMQEQMRVSSPSDLLLQVELECSLVTDVTTEGDDDQHAEAQFQVWVEIDGTPVTVSGDDTNGKVVFCNRRYQRIVSGLNDVPDTDDSDDDLTIETFLSTRSTHGFNWIAIDAGRDTVYDTNNDNILNIEVWADYTESETARGNAEAVIGKRTLIIEPTKLSVHEIVVEEPGVGN